jgi:hypothetical protein
MRALFSAGVTLLLLLGLAPACPAEENPYQDLIRRLPGSTNILIVADVQGLRQALGVPPDTALMVADAGSLPVTAKTFVLGAHVDIGERRHVWSIALARMARPLPIQDLAKIENQPADEVAGQQVVACRRNAYFVDLGPELLAIGSPANRQQLKKWLTFQKSNPLPAISPYLLQAANPKEPALIVMAADLSDVFDLTSIKRGLDTSRVLTSRKKPDKEGVAKTLAKASGIRLTIRPGKGYPLHGELAVDFTTETEAIRDFGKPLLLEILDRADLMVSDFNDWRPQPKERSIGIQGPLSVNALRKFASLIKTPAPAPEAANLAKYESQSPGVRGLEASKRYFKTVRRHLDDLKAEKGTTKSMAGWYDQFATQIDNMPILDVDQELVQFAATTSAHLRSMAASLKGIVVQSGQLQKQKNWTTVSPAYYGFYGTYGNWGYVGNSYDITTGYAYMQQQELVTQGKQARVALWEQIDQETANVRRAMTQKYGTEF